MQPSRAVEGVDQQVVAGALGAPVAVVSVLGPVPGAQGGGVAEGGDGSARHSRIIQVVSGLGYGIFRGMLENLKVWWGMVWLCCGV